MLYNQWHIKIHVLFPSSLKKDWSDFFNIFFLILELYQTDKKKIYTYWHLQCQVWNTFKRKKCNFVSNSISVYCYAKHTKTSHLLSMVNPVQLRHLNLFLHFLASKNATKKVIRLPQLPLSQNNCPRDIYLHYLICSALRP